VARNGWNTMNAEQTSSIPATYTQSPFWTADEAASYCRISINTLQQLLRTGEIPARRVGRQWRILKRDLDDYLGVGPSGVADRNGR